MSPGEYESAGGYYNPCEQMWPHSMWIKLFFMLHSLLLFLFYSVSLKSCCLLGNIMFGVMVTMQGDASEACYLLLFGKVIFTLLSCLAGIIVQTSTACTVVSPAHKDWVVSRYVSPPTFASLSMTPSS